MNNSNDCRSENTWMVQLFRRRLKNTIRRATTAAVVLEYRCLSLTRVLFSRRILYLFISDLDVGNIWLFLKQMFAFNFGGKIKMLSGIIFSLLSFHFDKSIEDAKQTQHFCMSLAIFFLSFFSGRFSPLEKIQKRTSFVGIKYNTWAAV